MPPGRLAGLAGLLHHPQAQDAFHRPWTEQLLDDLLLLAGPALRRHDGMPNLNADASTKPALSGSHAVAVGV